MVVLQVLREVKVLSSLQHVNIVGYHTAWLEHVQPADSEYLQICFTVKQTRHVTSLMQISSVIDPESVLPALESNVALDR